jgi:arsenate reductase
MPDALRVLFLCTHNSARSQMAEGLLRELGADRFDVASAGTEARGLNPLAVQAMAEEGIDISSKQRRHWSFPDPSAVVGDDETKFAAFRVVRAMVRERIERELLAVHAG